MSWITTPSQKVPPYSDLVFDINVTTTFELRTTSPLCTYVVDWGDRSIETVVNTATVSHTYANPGAYTVSINVISGVFRPYYNAAASGDLINFVTNRIDGVFSGSLQNAFLGSAALQSFQSSSGSGITDLISAFQACTALNSFEVLDKNLSDVISARQAFLGTGSIAFNGYNLSGLIGTQGASGGGSFGVFGSSIVSLRSGVTSIGTTSEPVILGTTSAANLNIRNFAYGCASLTSVCFDSGVRITDLTTAFLDCSSLDFFDILDKDLSNVTSIYGAFVNTGAISFNGFNLSKLTGNQYSSTTGVFGRGSGATSDVISIGTLSEPITFGTTGGNTFTLAYFAMNCTNLAEVCFDSGVKLTVSLYRAFHGCTSLTTFNILDKNLSNITDMRDAFMLAGSFAFNGYNLSGMSGAQYSTSTGVFWESGVLSLGTLSEPLVFGTSGGNTFDIRNFARGCTNLTQSCFDSGFKITGLNAAFYLCSALTTFTILDAATVGLANITDMTNAFFGCALTAASIENILVACDTGGKTGVTLTLNGGTNAGYSTWTATAQAALASLQAKSWTVTYNA